MSSFRRTKDIRQTHAFRDEPLICNSGVRNETIANLMQPERATGTLWKTLLLSPPRDVLGSGIRKDQASLAIKCHAHRAGVSGVSVLQKQRATRNTTKLIYLKSEISQIKPVLQKKGQYSTDLSGDEKSPSLAKRSCR